MFCVALFCVRTVRVTVQQLGFGVILAVISLAIITLPYDMSNFPSNRNVFHTPTYVM